jgi:hypothetical protein
MITFKLKNNTEGIEVIKKVFPNAEKINKDTGIPNTTGVRFCIKDRIVNPEDIKINEFNIYVDSVFFPIVHDALGGVSFAVKLIDDKKSIEVNDFKQHYDYYGESKEEPLNEQETEKLTTWLKEKFSPYAEEIIETKEIKD